jgi:hypothetical protein
MASTSGLNVPTGLGQNFIIIKGFLGELLYKLVEQIIYLLIEVTLFSFAVWFYYLYATIVTNFCGSIVAQQGVKVTPVFSVQLPLCS